MVRLLADKLEEFTVVRLLYEKSIKMIRLLYLQMFMELVPKRRMNW